MLIYIVQAPTVPMFYLSLCSNNVADGRHYEGFSSDDCTGTVVLTHEEAVKGGCGRRYESEKCILPGYLVSTKSMNGVATQVTARPLEQCVKTNSGWSKMSQLKRENDGQFSYYVYEWDAANASGCEGSMSNSEIHFTPKEEIDSEEMDGANFEVKHWHAKNLKDAINLDLYKVAGNKAWNDWYTLDTYANDMCEGAAQSTVAGKQYCVAGHTNTCDEHGMLTSQKYTTGDCMTVDGAPSQVFDHGECKMVGPGMYQKATCHFRGQEYASMDE